MSAANVRIVLVNTSHPGNIGAVARAMKNMALEHLYLVNPAQFPHGDASARASGADDILANACVVKTLTEALADCHVVYGTSTRPRGLNWPISTPKQAAAAIIPRALQHHVAVVFGNEQSGLTNDELACCQHQIIIPTSPTFSSLNIAAAVQVICYEIYQASLAQQQNVSADAVELATQAEIEFLFGHFERVLTRLHFLNPKQPKYLTTRMRRLFARTYLEKSEVNIWRGILTAIEKQMGMLGGNDAGN